MTATRGLITLRRARSRRLRARILIVISCLCALLLTTCQGNMAPGPPIMIGLIAPLSGGSAASGEAVQRGMLLALDEVNRAGGVLGRPLSLVVRDVQNDPPAGVAAWRELVQQHAIVAVFGGIFSPVLLAQLDAIHELEIPSSIPGGRSLPSPAPAFTPERHDPLLAEDYLMAVWQNGWLVPAPQPRLRQGT